MTFHSRQDETSEWLNYLQPEGLVVGANVLRETGVTPIRQTPLDTEAAAKALHLDPDAPLDQDRLFELQDVWAFFEQVLGWPSKLVAGSPGGPAVDPALNVTIPEHETLLAPDLALLWNGEAPEGVPAQALVMLHPGLDADDRNQFAAGEWEATPHQRLERLLRETNVGVGILVAQNMLRLVYAPRGETAGWLSWPLAALGRVEGRPMLAGLKLCLGRNAFFTGAPETRLRKLLEASREAQNAVSEKLSGQVLGALYELLRELHRAAPQEIEGIAERDPHHLYEGLLTVLMRLVFLLYAEDRDLLPSSPDPHLKQLWENGYSIKTLYARLLVDEALNPDTMDERRGAWGQLLAVFRLVHGGHPDWVTGRGGKLFDPDLLAFLEGREGGSSRADSTILPVSDGTILRILHGLMTIDGRGLSGEKIRERLSYRSLDVESIGSVYETVMGFTASRATERMIALRDEKKLPNFVGLDALLAQKPGDRQKWLKERGIKLSTKQAKGIKDARDVAELIEAFGSLVDERASPKATAIGPGVPYLQPTDERRRSGSHYTPRSLTEPIVRHALEPAFQRLGDKASPEAVLSLKVLDPACGSGAFLVEACRQIGARLEQAWNMYGAEKPKIPPDEDEALHARRLVAQKCLYGVDRNPMAVDLARLSLWLATLARDHEFTFLDHALKAGDSLVGLTRAQIQAVHWDQSKPGLPLFRETIGQAVERAREGREAIRNASDDVRLEAQAARYTRVQDESEPARIVGDTVVAAFFAGDKPRIREIERASVESLIAGSLQPQWNLLNARANALRAEKDWHPFHWEIEYPEVFSRNEPGFDAIVGNPPFLGVTSLGMSQSESYTAFLRATNPGSGGKCDLVAFFFRRAFSLLRDHGCLGMIASKSIAQGNTRVSGLAHIVDQDGVIVRATKRLKWPGTANVVVAVVHLVKKVEWSSQRWLDDRPVERINSFLVEGGEPNVSKLFTETPAAFVGAVVRGGGFIVDPENDLIGGQPLARFLAQNPNYLDVIKPFWGGESLNNSVELKPSRYVIDFADRTLEEAGGWPQALNRLQATVLEQRSSSSARSSTETSFQEWWKFGRRAKALHLALAAQNHCLARSEVSWHHMVARVRTGPIFQNTVVVFVDQTFGALAVLQSRTHEIWAYMFGSSMKNDPRYVPRACCATFPFPRGYKNNHALETRGRLYDEHRSLVMASANEGMTKTYNRFHDREERSQLISRMRELHDDMDREVLRAYGWNDLADELRPVFLSEENEEDRTYQGRYFWPSDQRDRVFSRLLALNGELHTEEVAAGLVPAKASRETTEDVEDVQDSLDLE